jgi:uncharacterized protein YneF (UPF0154 family)
MPNTNRMNLIKILISITLLILMIFGGIFLSLRISQNQADQKVRNNIHKIRLGMNRNEVKALIGEPAMNLLSNKAKQMETWIYPYPRNEQEWPAFVFDAQTGNLMKIETVYDF